MSLFSSYFDKDDTFKHGAKKSKKTPIQMKPGLSSKVSKTSRTKKREQKESIFESISENNVVRKIPKLKTQMGRTRPEESFRGRNPKLNSIEIGNISLDYGKLLKSSKTTDRKGEGFLSSARERKNKNTSLMGDKNSMIGDEELTLIELVKRNNEQGCFIALKKGSHSLSQTGENGWTALHFACWIGNFKIVNMLILEGADVNFKAKSKITPLIVASMTGKELIIQLLLNAGAELDSQDSKGATALHYACQSNKLSAVKELVARGTDLNITNSKGRSAIDCTTSEEIVMFITKEKKKKEDLEKEISIVPIFSYTFDKIRKIFSSSEVQASPVDPEVKEIEAQGDNSTPKVGPQDFDIIALLGRGSFGEVYLVKKKDTGKNYAMKLLQKEKIVNQNLLKYAITERNVLSYIRHPFIVELYYAFQTSNKLGLILEYCPGGDLGTNLEQDKRFSEDRARDYLCEVIIALEELHSRDIIFRDLKPDNVVLDEEGHLKLTDFGLSKEGVNDHTTGAKSFCGTVAYLAPEMLKKSGHGKAVDWYLLGVLFYEMIIGIPPYYAPTKEQLFENIQNAPLKVPKGLSTNAKSLLKQLLQRDPRKRLGSGDGDAQEVKLHPFFEGINWKDVWERKLPMKKPQVFVQEFNKPISSTFIFGEENGLESAIPGWSFVQNRTVGPN